MKFKDLSLLSGLMVLSKEALRSYENDETRLDFNIKYWSKNGKIIPLKKGMYALSERWEREADKDGYREYVSNKLYEPSYLSVEYVMSKNGLLTEAVNGITAVTTNKTNLFTNTLGAFSYYSIAQVLFTGFYIKAFYGSTVFMATRAKATFDYLYLRFIRNTAINELAIDELRINWENLPKAEFLEIKNFTLLSGNKKIQEVCSLVEKMYYA